MSRFPEKPGDIGKNAEAVFPLDNNADAMICITSDQEKAVKKYLMKNVDENDSIVCEVIDNHEAVQKNPQDGLQKLQKFYPADTKILEINGSSMHNHTATLRLKCKNKDEFLNWLKQHQLLSGVTFRVRSSNNINGKTVLYKARYRCQHNTIPWLHGCKNPSKKHTECETKMVVTIKSSPDDRKIKTKDKLRMEYPTELRVNHIHNHLINGVEAMKYRDPEEEVQNRFLELFRSHHSPSRALYLYKQDLLEEYEDEFFKVAANTSICPDIHWVYNFYYRKFNEEFGSNNENVDLEALSKSYKDQGGIKLNYEFVNNNEYVIAACTPLIERVHSLSLSGHIVFIDSSGNMDRHNSRIFLLMTDSQVGGLPLGFFISTSESEAAITKGLELLKEILPAECFGQNGSRGPTVFMSDDSAAQQNALKNVFPQSKIWICSFHVLQSVWRWLMDKKHAVDENDRRDLYRLFKAVLVCSSDEDFKKSWSNLTNSEITKKYPLFNKYVEKLLVSADKWCHKYRSANRGNNTNNIVERAMGVLKDKILFRTRAYNIQQLLSYLCQTMPDFYKQKIIDAINGRYRASKYTPKDKSLRSLEVSKKTDNIFTVKNKDLNTFYDVNMDIGVCGCEVGKNGAPCKHQHYVAISYQLSCTNIVPISEEEKCFFHFIAKGSRDIPKNWYAPLAVQETVTSVPESTTSQEALNYPLPVMEADQCLPAGELIQDDDDKDLANIVDKCKKVADLIEFHSKSNRRVFSEAMDSFHSTLQRMGKESTIVSALHQFGKAFYVPLKAKKYRTAISVQPTAVTRRKYAITKGRRCLISGRPAKRNFTLEHGYTKNKKSRPGKVPHSLQECVDRNIPTSKK